MTPSPTPPFMSGGCAIKERLEADFRALFFPSPPVPVRATREIATYRSDYRLDGRTLVVERELMLSSPKIEPARFEELDALVDLMVEDRDQELDFAAAPGLIPAAADTAASAIVRASLGRS